MIDNKALYKIGCGLAILTAKEGDKDNGCVINTVMQVASNPTRLAISVNARNLTCEMIERTGVFNLSLLSTKVPFAQIKQFGYQSGRDANKLAGLPDSLRTENGLFALPFFACAILSGKVVQVLDLGSHKLFIAELTEAKKVSDDPILTYDYYQDNIKPKPAESAAPKKGKTAWRCKVCGWIWEGEELPSDIVCEICGHGAEDFEKITI